MTQVFRMMCATAAITLALSVQTAFAQQQPVKNPESSKLSNKREVLQKKKRAQSSSQSQETQQRIEKHRREHTVIDLPGYPKYVTTGKPEADEKAYQEAKAAWIKENPQLYKQYLKKEAEKSQRPSVASRRAANPINRPNQH